MKHPVYWKRYVLETDPDLVASQISALQCPAKSGPFRLLFLEQGWDAPSVLISQGPGGHAYVFAELLPGGLLCLI